MSNPRIHLNYFGEDPETFLHETSSLAKKVRERARLSAWHEEVFVPAVQASVEQSLGKYFLGDIEDALQGLKDDPSNQLWENFNDDLRMAISEIPYANQILGKENIEQALIHKPAHGLNELVKSYVNACLLLIQTDQKNAKEVKKEEVELPFNIDKIITNKNTMTLLEIQRNLKKAGFIKENRRGRGSPHMSYSFYKDDVFWGKISVPCGASGSQFRETMLSRLRHQLRNIGNPNLFDSTSCVK